MSATGRSPAVFASDAHLDYIGLTALTDEEWEELNSLLTEADGEGQGSGPEFSG